ncbi:hypothetical protein [Mycobacterium attenuatum]|uniref:hypothetical protein n=1 Tax=Mycobacterium attenuatum TaxID=2341086 RepID=UPI000F018F16|nr:hypothetical protein [Mycobacterium attenuatum]VBA55253.1 hypothetical protein LAUMK191_03304 [Mycobacterium attenuatum]VBA59257.1 hypothetical protein LAUMK41_03397 [Mycobacterium attenuatum]
METLLTGAGEGDGGDIGAAAEAVARLAAARGDEDLRSREINLLRWRAMLARARGDQGRYGGLRDRYRAMAASPGFEGHIAWAAAMT